MSKTPLCRQISLNIPNKDVYGRPQPGFIESVQPKGASTPTANFLASVLPGHKIEHVVRETLGFVPVDYNPEFIPSSSLFFQTIHE